MKSLAKKYWDSGLAYSAILAIIINLIIESLGRQSLWKGIGFLLVNPRVFLYNSFLIFLTLCISLLLRKRFLYNVILTSLWLALGITNGAVLSFRMTPFTVSDMALLENGLSILPNYLSTGKIILFIGGILLIFLIFVLIFIFVPKRKKRPNYMVNLLLIVVFFLSFAGLTNLGIEKRWLSTYFGNLAYAYSDYGVPYCFLNTWLIRGISTPSGYSAQMMREIFADGIPEGINGVDSLIPTLSETSKEAKLPNIVFVQLESFIDPMLIEKITLSQDPIPNFRHLQEKGSAGFLRVPSVGAGTANTEFEILTGMRIRAFGPGEYPYKTVLKNKTCGSVCYTLKKLGYSTHAIHNHRGAFYGRNEIFPNLGFDTFTSIEYMNRINKTPKNWAKDGVLTEEILAALNSTEGKDFVFAISVQGHGRYPEEKVIPDDELNVRVTGGLDDEKYLNSVEYYINQIFEMDQFVGELVNKLKDYEDTVVVFYGDHIPVLDLTEFDLSNGSVYETEYAVYSNFPLTKVDEDLASFQLSAQIFDFLGIHEDIITWHHQTKKDNHDYLKELDALQYDILYGNSYIFAGQNPYEPTEIKMGVRDILVDRIFDFGGSTYVVGENFTPYTKLAVNGNFAATTFVNSTILRVPGGVKSKNPKDYSISQVGKYKNILSTLKEVE